MKAVFLTLLAINILYFGWRLWIVPASAPPAFVEAENVPRLVLVGEDPAAVQAAMNPSARQRDGDVASRGSADQATGPGRAAPGGQTTGPGASDNQAASDGSGAASAVASGARPDRGAGSQLPGPAQPGRTAGQASGDGVSTQTSGEVAVSLAQRRCVSLGPFLNLREATEATAKLNEVGLNPNQRLAESQVWFGHWVHLPSLPSRAAAVEIVEGLRAQGISDIYIEPSGPFVNSISLGVFSDSAHAETRAGQIRKLGVSPQIRDRYRDSSVYWVDFELRPDQVIDPADYQASPARVLRLEGRACPEPA